MKMLREKTTWVDVWWLSKHLSIRPKYIQLHLTDLLYAIFFSRSIGLQHDLYRGKPFKIDTVRGLIAYANHSR